MDFPKKEEKRKKIRGFSRLPMKEESLVQLFLSHICGWGKKSGALTLSKTKKDGGLLVGFSISCCLGKEGGGEENGYHCLAKGRKTIHKKVCLKDRQAVMMKKTVQKLVVFIFLLSSRFGIIMAAPPGSRRVTGHFLESSRATLRRVKRRGAVCL